MIEWALALISLTGNYFNCRKKKVCFAIWIAVNVAWTTLDAFNGVWGRAFLDAVQIGFSVYGWKEWSR